LCASFPGASRGLVRSQEGEKHEADKRVEEKIETKRVQYLIDALPEEKRKALEQEATENLKKAGVSAHLIKSGPIVLEVEMRRLFRERPKGI